MSKITDAKKRKTQGPNTAAGSQSVTFITPGVDMGDGQGRGATIEEIERWDKSMAKTDRIGEKIKKIEDSREKEMKDVKEILKN